MGKRVVHVCAAHTADDGRVFHRACVSLAQAGYDVHLLAKSDREEPYQVNGVTVHPVKTPRERLKRYAMSGQVAARAAALNPDLFHVHEPDLLGPTVKRAGAKPVVWDVHESYMNVLADNGWIPKPLRGVVRTLWDRTERSLMKRVAGVIVVTEDIAKRYRAMHGNVILVRNYPDLQPIVDLGIPERDGKTVVFTGALSNIRGLLEAVEALRILKGRGVYARLLLVGSGKAEFMSQLLGKVEEYGLQDRFEYIKSVPKEKAMELQNGASIGIVTYLPSPNNVMGLPNKIPEFMAHALPLVYSHFENYTRVVGDDAGISVDPTDADQVANAIERLVNHPDEAVEMGRRGRERVMAEYNWSSERDAMLGMYRQLLGG